MIVYPQEIYEYTWLFFADECEMRHPRVNYWVAQDIVGAYVTFDLQDWGFITSIDFKNAYNYDSQDGSELNKIYGILL